MHFAEIACIQKGNRMAKISLSGLWNFRFGTQGDWQVLAVPGCWESLGIDKQAVGPAEYSTTITIPSDWLENRQRIWIVFEGVSYACQVWLDGILVGEHLGIWDSFRFEISELIRKPGEYELSLTVEKPAGPERGPSGKQLPGKYPLRETLSGFLPYVWGSIFGGIWQDVYLQTSGEAEFRDVYIQAKPDGTINVYYEQDFPQEVQFELYDPHGQHILSRTLPIAQTAIGDGLGSNSVTLRVEQPLVWSLEQPQRYTAKLSMGQSERSIQFGFRELEIQGTQLILNGQPIYLRMVLTWGWYEGVLHSNPGRERVRADMLRLKQLGYNGIKLCLWFPPDYFFELADELGMAIWVELPMWLPNATAFFQKQTPIEYERLVRQARRHPSVLVYTLGCELNRSVPAKVLSSLFSLVKGLAGDALVRDNSGSGEAYGGLLDEYAEFYDYHFYSDIQFYRGLIDEFSPRWRPTQPWLFGEFCDVDSYRDLRPLLQDGKMPWWLVADASINPQGARWQYDVPYQQQRLLDNGMWERSDELVQLSERQALFYRKYVLELMRTRHEISGYVITGERDTPISSPGMWDDNEQLRHDPAEFGAFNGDTVLAIGWQRRRAWVRGGDRASRQDTWGYSSGSVMRSHIIVSHFGSQQGQGRLHWQIRSNGNIIFDQQLDVEGELGPGDLREIAIVEWSTPHIKQVERYEFRVELRIAGQLVAQNQWPIWVFPKEPLKSLELIGLYDPSNRLADLRTLMPKLIHCADPSQLAQPSKIKLFRKDSEVSVLIATQWSSQIEDYIKQGGRVLLLHDGKSSASPFAVHEVPFWREGMRIPESHALWQDFPTDDVSQLFYGCATDVAFKIENSKATPLLRRLDLRTFRVLDYAALLPYEKGYLLATTLRFEGGLGDQPQGISRNTSAAYLLSCWLRGLASI
jgi:hypothetical protein